MQERTITMGCVTAALLWGLTVLFILTGTIVGVSVRSDVGLAIAISLMVHGLACSAGAATVTIRNGLHHQNKLLTDAFKLGQDSRSVRRLGS